MKLFVWDFHGVLEMGNEMAVLEISNKVLKDQGYSERVNKKIAVDLYGRKWWQYFEYLLPNEPREKHQHLQELCFTSGDWSVIEKNIRPNNYIHEVLDSIGKKHEQVIISNTQPTSLVKYLETVGISKYFPKTHAFAVNAHDNSGHQTKTDALFEFVGNKKYDDFIIIGDSPSDMELSNSFGGVTYLYAHPHLKHKECKSDYKINDLREVLKEI